MILTRRQKNAKQNRPEFVKFVPNQTGSGGSKCIRLVTASGTDLILRFETEDEVKQLLSQAHMVHHNFNDPHL